MSATTFIYCLTEPGMSGLAAIRYFGKADKPKTRLRAHIQYAKSGGEKMPVAYWIRNLLECGQRPNFHILCEVPSDDWERFERAFIALGRQHGLRLLNATLGGEGGMEGRKHTLETRKKIGRAGALNAMFGKFGPANPHFGMVRSEETCRKIGLKSKGRIPSAETRLKISAAGKGKEKPEGFGQKVSAGLRGVKKSLEHRKNLSLARTGSKDSDATSKFIGVSFFRPKHKTCNKPWRAMAYVNKERKQIGNFSSELEAARAYDEAAKKFHGEKTKLNFPNGLQ